MPESDEHIEDDYYNNSLELAGDNYNQSEVVKSFKHLPIDTKTAFLDNWEKRSYFYKSSAYDTLSYLDKCLLISNLELAEHNKKRKDIYKIKTFEEFTNYFKSINKAYLWNYFKSIEDNAEKTKLAKQLIEQLNRARLDGNLDDIYSLYQSFTQSNNEYKKSNKSVDYKDDIGLLNSMMTFTELSKGHKGKFANHLKSTISYTKDIDPEEEYEEEPERSESKSFLGFKKK